MALVAPGVCRFSVHGRIHDRPWVNVWDVDIDTDTFENRSNAIKDQAQVFLNEYIDELAPLCSAQWIVDSVSWVDLNAADGEVGTRNDPLAPRVLPFAGTNSGESENGSVAFLIVKRIAGARGRRNGRSYLAGVSETSATGQGVVAAFTSAALVRLPAFRDNVNQESTGLPGGATYSSKIVVVHTTRPTPDADPVFVAASEVTSLVLDPRLATQRRRLRP